MMGAKNIVRRLLEKRIRGPQSDLRARYPVSDKKIPPNVQWAQSYVDCTFCDAVAGERCFPQTLFRYPSSPYKKKDEKEFQRKDKEGVSEENRSYTVHKSRLVLARKQKLKDKKTSDRIIRNMKVLRGDYLGLDL